MDVARGPGSVDGSAASRSDPTDGVRRSGGSLAGARARRGATATRARRSALSAAASSSGRSVRAPPPQVAPPHAAAGRAGGPAVLAAVLAAAGRGGMGVGGARRFGSTGVISGRATSAAAGFLAATLAVATVTAPRKALGGFSRHSFFPFFARQLMHETAPNARERITSRSRRPSGPSSSSSCPDMAVSLF